MESRALCDRTAVKKLPAHLFFCLSLFVGLACLLAMCQDTQSASVLSVAFQTLPRVSCSTMQPVRHIAGRRVFKIPSLLCALSTCLWTFRNCSGLMQHLNWHHKLGHLPSSSAPTQDTTSTTTSSAPETSERTADTSSKVRYECHTVIDGILHHIQVYPICSLELAASPCDIDGFDWPEDVPPPH